MSRQKRELNFSVESTEQLIKLVEGISKLDADIDADSTPSSIEISVYGSEGKIRETSKKIRELVEESKSA